MTYQGDNQRIPLREYRMRRAIFNGVFQKKLPRMNRSHRKFMRKATAKFMGRTPKEFLHR